MIDGASPMAVRVQQLGVSAPDLEDTDHIVSMVVVAKIVNFETGGTVIGAYGSDGLDWVDKWGMLGAAYARARLLKDADDDDA